MDEVCFHEPQSRRPVDGPAGCTTGVQSTIPWGGPTIDTAPHRHRFSNGSMVPDELQARHVRRAIALCAYESAVEVKGLRT